jgi:hypothetical protein
MRNRSGIILIEDNKLALIERHRNGLHYFIFLVAALMKAKAPSRPQSAKLRRNWESLSKSNKKQLNYSSMEIHNITF